MPRAREPEPVAGLFETSQAGKRIARMLDKAVERRIGKAARGVPRPKVRLPGGSGRKAQRSTLGLALAKALGVRRGGRDKPSLRMKAPDTGGEATIAKADDEGGVGKGAPKRAGRGPVPSWAFGTPVDGPTPQGNVASGSADGGVQARPMSSGQRLISGRDETETGSAPVPKPRAEARTGRANAVMAHVLEEGNGTTPRRRGTSKRQQYGNARGRTRGA